MVLQHKTVALAASEGIGYTRQDDEENENNEDEIVGDDTEVISLINVRKDGNEKEGRMGTKRKEGKQTFA